MLDRRWANVVTYVGTTSAIDVGPTWICPSVQRWHITSLSPIACRRLRLRNIILILVIVNLHIVFWFLPSGGDRLADDPSRRSSNDANTDWAHCLSPRCRVKWQPVLPAISSQRRRDVECATATTYANVVMMSPDVALLAGLAPNWCQAIRTQTVYSTTKYMGIYKGDEIICGTIVALHGMTQMY